MDTNWVGAEEWEESCDEKRNHGQGEREAEEQPNAASVGVVASVGHLDARRRRRDHH